MPMPMSRNWFALLSFVVACTVGAQGTAPAGAAVCPGYANIDFCGELTGDCKVTSTDALKALRIGVGQLAQDPIGDVDNSGTVTSSDALRILKMAVAVLPIGASCGKQYGVTATATGTYSDAGVHGAGNYAVGWYASGADEIRDYFIFDISAVPGVMTSALLHLSATIPGNSGFSSSDPNESFDLRAVSMSANTLSGGGGGVAAFSDLGDGTIYGNILLTNQTPDPTDVVLNAAGLSYLNGASSTVVFGGVITTLAKGATSERYFNSTNATLTRQLVVTLE